MKAGKPARRLVRNPAVTFTELDGDVFLVEPESQEVYYLNPVASALWRLLASPLVRAEVVEVFVAAFPTVGHGRLVRDLARVIGDLRRRGLIAEID